MLLDINQLLQSELFMDLIPPLYWDNHFILHYDTYFTDLSITKNATTWKNFSMEEWEVEPFALYNSKTGGYLTLNWDEFWNSPNGYLDEEGFDIRYSFKYTLPEAKLFYPEPYIASPSYIHSDLTFLCILQYWYWLWFIFIYLIIFFFLAFIVTVRWCATHKKPSRETQGVSRSKCGDLITACVPVSWAASIIISESTDAADINDGFGTGEVVIGVRAYQWGWEYYYPRSIDLLYNVKPTYSSFIGNSLRYQHASDATNSTNAFWKQYQSKVQDAPVTPASLIFNSLKTLPSGSQNFNVEAGLNNLNLASSFPKIRNNTKIYNTHLINQPLVSTSKTFSLSQHYSTTINDLSSLDYQTERVSNLISPISSIDAPLFKNNSQTVSKFIHSNETNYLTMVQKQDSNLVQSTNLTPALSTLTDFNATPTLADLEDKILPTEQSIQQQAFPKLFDVTPLKSAAKANNVGLNLISNLKSIRDLTSFNYFDLHQDVNSFLTGRVFSSKSFVPVTSTSILRNNSETNIFEGTQLLKSTSRNLNTLSKLTNSTPGSTIEANLGSIDKIPGTLLNLYWTTSWNNISPSLKDSLVFNGSSINGEFYLPQFTTYADYDFRNEQSLMLMEDLFWESSYQTFSFYDYLTLTEHYTKSLQPTAKISDMDLFFHSSNNTLPSNLPNTTTNQTNVSFLNLHSDTSFNSPLNLTQNNLELLALLADSADLEESYATTKFTTLGKLKNEDKVLWLDLGKTFFSSSTKIFNHFTTSYESFNNANFKNLNLTQSVSADLNLQEGRVIQTPHSWLRVKSNPCENYLLHPFLDCLFTLFLESAPYTEVVGEWLYNKSFQGIPANYASSPLFVSLQKVNLLYTYISDNRGLITPWQSSFITNSNLYNFNWKDSFKHSFEVYETCPGIFMGILLKDDSGQPLWVYSDWCCGWTNTLKIKDSGLTTSFIKVLDINLVESLKNSTVGFNFSYHPNYLSSNSSLSQLNIRQSVKDSIVNYNAFQKVFRSRLDENRSHTSSSNFKTLFNKQPFIKDLTVPYTSMLGKNRTFFYQTPFYNQNYVDTLNSLSPLFTQSNVQTFEFPFLEALQSDLIRYTWMDGYAKWKYVEVQPSSVSKYSLVGVPYLRKPYDFNTNTGDSLSELQTYFTRITRARKNYLPNWLYSPTLYNRVSLSNNRFDLIENLTHSGQSVKDFYVLLNELHAFIQIKNYNFKFSNLMTASFSGNSIHSKSTWRPQGGLTSYYHLTPHLVDILTKREHLIRDYFTSQKGSTYLPVKLTASPSNPILTTVIKSFNVNDPLTLMSEYSREYVYSSVQYYKFLELKSFVRYMSNVSTHLPFNLSALNDYTLFYFINNNDVTFSKSNELYRNQFRPLRKGVNSMLRLHATGAIAMPVEIRLQILASSRDVIHSWAIPSAGIKIDCIPGYTSHRIMKFMITGIYWGQCQEICGRYHHWMPIVVYFVKRDLFFLWCTHFVYKPTRYDDWVISDRQFANFLRFVSYDRSSWLSEVSNL